MRRGPADGDRQGRAMGYPEEVERGEWGEDMGERGGETHANTWEWEGGVDEEREWYEERGKGKGGRSRGRST